jgi:hypothetical protein
MVQSDLELVVLIPRLSALQKRPSRKAEWIDPMKSLLPGLLFLLITDPAIAEPACTYSTYKWNTQQRKAVQFERVEKWYSQVEAREIDEQTGCTVCEQDQTTVSLPGIEAFKVCRIVAKSLRDALAVLIQNGEPINSIIGYRVGMTRGDVDLEGNRTGFSNHSFGVAIDINPDSNGLYDDCILFNDTCRLIKGGPWRPGSDRFSLHSESHIVKKMKAAGFLWGGEIQGRQKDFMHFSLSGY